MRPWIGSCGRDRDIDSRPGGPSAQPRGLSERTKTKTVSKLPKAGLLSAGLILFLTQGAAHAEDGSSAAAQANNPLANMTAFNLQNYYIGRLTETDDDANQFWFRYAQPLKLFGGEWLMRASLPVKLSDTS